MPIFDLGYRSWEGRLRSSALRWWTIAGNGVALAWRSKILRRLMVFAWTPLLYFAPLFFTIGYITDPARNLAGDSHSLWWEIAQGFLGHELADRLGTDPESIRPAAWSMAFYYFFSYTQAWLTMLIVAIVGPPLISQDVRSKAFLLYFSKPIERWHYLFGKMATLLFYVFLVTLIPALVLYAISIAFSPTLLAFLQTGQTILWILATSLVIAVPATLIVTCFSSLTSDHRYATLGWITYWILGEIGYTLLSEIPALRDSSWIFLLSLRKTTSVITQAIFNVAHQLRMLGHSEQLDRLIRELRSPYSSDLGIGFLLTVSILCLLVIVRRISAPMRI